MTELVHYLADHGVATITLDSPHNRNALSEALVGQLRAALGRTAGDDAVRAVVLTHAGGTFCAGADLSEALARGESAADASAAATGQMIELMRTIVELPKPVIARIDGHVRAGGFGLVGACDIAVGGPACTFALTESRLGLAPSVISLTLLPRLTDRAAGRYFITGETFGADTAERLGLLTVAVADSAALGSTVSDMLDGIRKASPQGLAASKALTTRALRERIDTDAQRLAEESAALFATDEAREGMAAFLGKRAPAWDLTGPA